MAGGPCHPERCRTVNPVGAFVRLSEVEVESHGHQTSGDSKNPGLCGCGFILIGGIQERNADRTDGSGSGIEQA